MHLLTLIGLLFIALGTGLTIFGQQIVNNKSTDLLQAKSDKITTLSEENIRLSSELNKINKDIAASVTGGDSYCYLELAFGDDRLNTAAWVLITKGKHPMFDVDMSIEDVDARNNLLNIGSHISLEEYQSTKTYNTFRNLISDRARIVGSFNLSNKDHARYDIEFISRNGLITQKIRMVKKNNKWVTATIVVRENGGDSKTLHKYIDKDYPRTKNGTVDWR